MKVYEVWLADDSDNRWCGGQFYAHNGHGAMSQFLREFEIFSGGLSLSGHGFIAVYELNFD